MSNNQMKTPEEKLAHTLQTHKQEIQLLCDQAEARLLKIQDYNQGNTLEAIRAAYAINRFPEPDIHLVSEAEFPEFLNRTEPACVFTAPGNNSWLIEPTAVMKYTVSRFIDAIVGTTDQGLGANLLAWLHAGKCKQSLNWTSQLVLQGIASLPLFELVWRDMIYLTQIHILLDENLSKTIPQQRFRVISICGDMLVLEDPICAAEIGMLTPPATLEIYHNSLTRKRRIRLCSGIWDGFVHFADVGCFNEK